jgi:hypothetical protein
MFKLIVWFVYFTVMFLIHCGSFFMGILVLLRGENPLLAIAYLLLSFLTYFLSKDTAESIKSQIDATERINKIMRSAATVPESFKAEKLPRPYKQEGTE